MPAMLRELAAIEIDDAPIPMCAPAWSWPCKLYRIKLQEKTGRFERRHDRRAADSGTRQTPWLLNAAQARGIERL